MCRKVCGGFGNGNDKAADTEARSRDERSVAKGNFSESDDEAADRPDGTAPCGGRLALPASAGSRRCRSVRGLAVLSLTAGEVSSADVPCW
jgi:hypothetical protein